MAYFSEDPQELAKEEVIGLSADLSWSDLAIPAQLTETIKKYGREGEEDETLFTVCVVSGVEHPVGLRAFVHGHIENERLSHFQVSISRKPEKVPPPYIVEMSEDLGGYPRGLLEFLSLFDGVSGHCDAEVSFVFRKAPLDLTPRQLHSISPFRWKGEEFTVARPDGATVEYSWDESEGALATVKWEFDLALDPNCFENAARQLREVLSPLTPLLNKA